jgi:arylsulfatase K
MKKNIIFIHCDSMDGRVMGCMDHPAMVRATPNLDALADRGVLFRNTYCNSPVCCPSRASMWSGQFTHNCEGWNNHKGLEEGTPTFKTKLDEAGYKTVTFGKTDYLSGYHSIRSRVTSWAGASNVHRPTIRIGPPKVTDDDDPRIHKGDWNNIDKSIEWIKETIESDEEKPFMLYLGIHTPHPSFYTSQRYMDMIEESGITIPKKDKEVHPVIHFQKVAENWEHGFSEETVKLVRHIYFAMIAEVDVMVGKLVEAVEDMGLLENTYIIFGSDHGEMAMEHDMYYKMNMYEPSARVPLIVTGPGVSQGVKVDELVSLVDIYPTLMDMADLEHPQDLDGHSLMPELTGGESLRPDWVICEYHGECRNTNMFMFRHGDWKYIVYTGYEPQLFNVKEDPDEMHDLAKDRPDIVKEMDDMFRQVVDYEEVAARNERYNKESFRKWREEEKKQGTYEETMARIYSGWDNLSDEDIMPWTDEDEKLIEEWLERD